MSQFEHCAQCGELFQNGDEVCANKLTDRLPVHKACMVDIRMKVYQKLRDLWDRLDPDGRSYFDDAIRNVQ